MLKLVLELTLSVHCILPNWVSSWEQFCFRSSINISKPRPYHPPTLPTKSRRLCFLSRMYQQTKKNIGNIPPSCLSFLSFTHLCGFSSPKTDSTSTLSWKNGCRVPKRHWFYPLEIATQMLQIQIQTSRFSSETYCWWTKSCTTWDDNYPIIYRVLTIPGGAGFLPSTIGFSWLVMRVDNHHPLMVSFPYSSHTIPISLEGILWEAYHKGVPLLLMLQKSGKLTSWGKGSWNLPLFTTGCCIHSNGGWLFGISGCHQQ